MKQSNKNNKQPCISTVSISYVPKTRRNLPHLTQSQQPARTHLRPPQPFSPVEQVFNDSKLKLPQELLEVSKQAGMSRFRINLYRRVKKPFYESSLSNAETILPRQQNHTAMQFKQSETVQNRPCFRRRKLISFDEQSINKCKTYSSQNKQSLQHLNRQDQNNTAIQRAQPSQFQMQTDLHKKLYENAQLNSSLANINKAVMTVAQERARQLSNLTDLSSPPLKRRYLKEDRLNLHSRTLKAKQKSRVDITIDDQSESRAVFQAWENVDVFNSNKNGIVEYTRKAVQSNVQGNLATEKKSRRRFLNE